VPIREHGTPVEKIAPDVTSGAVDGNHPPQKHFLDEAEKQLTFDPSKPKLGHVGRAVNYFCDPLEVSGRTCCVI
jgi:hypothetical protein